MLTILRCNPEQAMIASLIAEQAAEERDIDARLDNLARLSGPCEGCRDEPGVDLVIIGGEALCPGCVEAMGKSYADEVERTWVPVAPREAS